MQREEIQEWSGLHSLGSQTRPLLNFLYLGAPIPYIFRLYEEIPMKRILCLLAIHLNVYAHTNWHGNYYADHSDMQYRMAIETLKYLNFPAKAKILDIGCGDGRVTKYISDLVPGSQVIGIDRSASMITKAQRHAHNRLSFIQADAVALPFESQFDFIVSFNCLHWVADIQTALTKINDALVPGGLACILIAPTQARYPIHHIIDSIAKQDPWSAYFGPAPSVFTLYTFAEWARLIEEAGMIPEQLQLVSGSLDYQNKTTFGNWLAGWIPFGTIPENRRSEFLQNIVDAYTAITPCEADGTVHFYLDELMILASAKS